MRSTKNYCSSSLWTCLHHMVILISQNKNHRFFYDFSLSMSLQRVKDRDNHGNLDIQSVQGLLLTRPCSLTRAMAHIYQNCYFFFSPRHNRPAQNHSDHSTHIDIGKPPLHLCMQAPCFYRNCPFRAVLLYTYCKLINTHVCPRNIWQI